ncbi:MAG: hypothetical protein IAE83_18235 [Anaerolinea sp.]|nr:hypothetical protein [Anaerolinea sp.]
MIHLHIEHGVGNYDAWKAAFDNDPAGRQKSGVRRYRILRPVDNPSTVIIDLEFDRLDQAEALLAAMQQVWKGIGGMFVNPPQWQIAEIMETREY